VPRYHQTITTPSKRDITDIEPLKIVHCTYDFDVKHLRGRKAAQYIPGPIIIGDEWKKDITVGSWEDNLKHKIVSAGIPDIAYLLSINFIELVSNEISNWPTTILEEQHISDCRKYIEDLDLQKEKPGNRIVFNCVPQYNTKYGLQVMSSMYIYDSQGNLIWGPYLRGYSLCGTYVEYNSEFFGRRLSLEEYSADNFKLLKEEMEFAAEIIAKKIINLLKNLPDTTQ
jgi:hypothetical protein